MTMKTMTMKLLKITICISIPALLLAQSLPPWAICGPEPPVPHNCSTQDPCAVHRVCQGWSYGFGNSVTYCCYENINGSCIQVEGKWECCSTDGGTWKAACIAAEPNPYQNCINGRCLP